MSDQQTADTAQATVSVPEPPDLAFAVSAEGLAISTERVPEPNPAKASEVEVPGKLAL